MCALVLTLLFGGLKLIQVRWDHQDSWGRQRVAGVFFLWDKWLGPSSMCEKD